MVSISLSASLVVEEKDPDCGWSSGSQNLEAVQIHLQGRGDIAIKYDHDKTYPTPGAVKIVILGHVTSRNQGLSPQRRDRERETLGTRL